MPSDWVSTASSVLGITIIYTNTFPASLGVYLICLCWALSKIFCSPLNGFYCACLVLFHTVVKPLIGTHNLMTSSRNSQSIAHHCALMFCDVTEMSLFSNLTSFFSTYQFYTYYITYCAMWILWKFHIFPIHILLLLSVVPATERHDSYIHREQRTRRPQLTSLDKVVNCGRLYYCQVHSLP